MHPALSLFLKKNDELRNILYLCTKIHTTMKARHILTAALMAAFSLSGYAQRVVPTATYVDDNKTSVDSKEDFTAQAPLDVTFRANPEGIEDHTAAFEWHIRKEGEEQDIVVRYEEDTQYTFVESGAFKVTLKARLTDIDHEMDSVTIKVTISESRLEFPNAAGYSVRNQKYMAKFAAIYPDAEIVQ